MTMPTTPYQLCAPPHAHLSRSRWVNTSGLPLLPQVDPRDQLPPVPDQGKVRCCCVAEAVCAACMYDAIQDGMPTAQLSVMFLWHQGEALSRESGNTGVFVPKAFRAASLGLPPDTAWPWADPEVAPADPPAAALAEQGYYRLAKPYSFVPPDEEMIRRVLSNGQPIVFGAKMYPTWISEEVKASGLVPMPEAGQKPIGGHGQLIVGYLEDYPGHFLVRGSYGPDFGMGGYVLMPVPYILNSLLTHDRMTIDRQVAEG